MYDAQPRTDKYDSHAHSIAQAAKLLTPKSQEDVHSPIVTDKEPGPCMCTQSGWAARQKHIKTCKVREHMWVAFQAT